jgi:xanthine dehydrogenase accessory factor
VLRRAHDTVARRGRVALAQIVRVEGSTAGKTGWKLLVGPDGETEGNLGGGAFEAMVIADARAKLAAPALEGSAGELKRYYMTEEAAKGQPTGMVCGGLAEVYLEVIQAPPVALVYGGGPVGQALARGAELAGFDLVVIDDRPEFRRPELFPEAATIPEVDRRFDSREGSDYLDPISGRELYAAVVTRCWETDVAAIATLLAKNPEHLAYLGLMGSRRKIDRVREELAALGVRLDGVHLHAPIGLPIGGDSPGEIAIGILAEMIQARYARG